MNRIGLTHFSLSSAAEDLGLTLGTFTKRFANVCRTFGWQYDGRARVLYVPSWWTFNRPENENVLKGVLHDLCDVPASPLVDEFARNLETLPQTFHQTFQERLGQRLAQRSPIQEQEQEQEPVQEQRPKSSALRALHSVASEEECGVKVLTKIAHEVIDTSGGPDAPLDDLSEALKRRCASLQIHYGNSRRIAKALDSALFQKRRWRGT